MVSDHHDSQTVQEEPNPAALSFAGGFAGTVTGLKRGGLPGAVLGGVVGGTVGYLAGASAKAESVARDSQQTEPIHIDTSGADTDEPSQETATGDDGTTSGDDMGDHDQTKDDDQSDSSNS
jgi:uncharacterized membrane protein